MASALWQRNDWLRAYLSLFLRDDLWLYHVSRSQRRSESEQRLMDLQLRDNVNKNVKDVIASIQALVAWREGPTPPPTPRPTPTAPGASGGSGGSSAAAAPAPAPAAKGGSSKSKASKAKDSKASAPPAAASKPPGRRFPPLSWDDVDASAYHPQVYQLIASATDITNLAKVQPTWHPWF